MMCFLYCMYEIYGEIFFLSRDFILGEGVHLRLESSCIRVNMVYGS